MAKKKIKRIWHPIVVQTSKGLEDVLYKEVLALGGRKVERRPFTVSFEGDRRLLYKANLELRTAIRVLKPLFQFQFKTQEEFYYRLREHDWLAIFGVKDSFLIEASVQSQIFTHSKYLKQKAKDAIVDKFRHARNVRPSVDTEQPDFRFHLYVQEDQCTVSLDSSGAPLNQRGYRSVTGEAPINEALAAMLILQSGWDGQSVLLDPMCGAGTIAIEAALYASRIAPGLLRKEYAFMRWRDYQPAIYASLIEEARHQIRPGKPGLIFARDRDEGLLRHTAENIRRAGVSELIDLKAGDFFRAPAPADQGTLIMNPPYGERLKPRAIGRFYKAIGDQLAELYAAWSTTIISSNYEALESIALPVAKRTNVRNGSLLCEVQQIRPARSMEQAPVPDTTVRADSPESQENDLAPNKN
ncbi:MAG: hypothetical protein KDK39_02360 [Leptospiraceae bacterium]|nr:hypothetical protein [Leptospiraceae bacterium]